MKIRYDLFGLETGGEVRSFKSKWPLWASFAFVLLLGGLYLLREGATPESIFAIAGLAAGGIAFFYAMAHAASLRTNPFREWWLTLPVSRTKLVRAKMVSLLIVSGLIGIAFWLVATLAAIISLLFGETSIGAATPGSVLTAAGAYALFTVAILPLGVSLGFLLLWMYGGLRRYLLIPYLFVLFPFGLFVIVLDSGEAVQKWLAPEAVLVYSLIVGAAGSVMYRLTRAVVSSQGMSDLAAFRIGDVAKSWREPRKRAETKIGHFTPETGRFRILYAYERSRYAYATSLRPVIIILRSLAVLLAVAGYFSFGSREGTVGLVTALMIFAFIGTNIMCSLSNVLPEQRARLTWWLMFPVGRKKLLLARVAAIWTTVYRIAFAGLLCIIAGGAVRYAVNGHYPGDAKSDAELLAYTVLFYVVLSTLFAFLLQVQSYTLRNRVIAYLYIPILIGSYWVPTAVSNRLINDEMIAAGVGSYQWTILLAVIVIGTPLAVAAFFAGAKTLHLFLVDPKAQQRSASKEGRLLRKR
ncbi:ABC-2 transporter permease [Cohnella faecalis]|uniref:Uncharacterized protein n=1 Tax=Cohnella faecalis TaxID=2315694 RepID=A0A398CHP5_9BACL|nr:hypothetical protein [Cohnella faecalis]RIE02756.1 hypothetical protein D3H35_19125 [Cohnella faecalis]